MNILFENGEEFPVTHIDEPNCGQLYGMIFFRREDGIEYNVGLGVENKFKLIIEDEEYETNKTFRQRNDKKNKGQEKCFLQKIRKILASFSNCIERIFAQK